MPHVDRAVSPWWQRPGLEVHAGRLAVCGQDAETLARRLGTPLFVTDVDRVVENARRLRAGFRAAGFGLTLPPAIVRFALKANRQPAVLAALRRIAPPGDPEAVGIDACSPGEVELALAAGWRAGEISFTGTNLSDRDLDRLLPTGVHLNLDAVSQVERVGRRAPGRSIGLRLNPGRGVGYHEGLAYSGERPTKFGIYTDRLDEALAVAGRHDLVVDTVHVHAGSGWLADALPAFEAVLDRVRTMAEQVRGAGAPLGEVNVGGGIGVPARAEEPPVEPADYATAIRERLRPLLEAGVRVACEPGDFVVKDAAILLAEVVTVEERGGTTFVGLDVGWNNDCAYFIYRFAQELVVCRAADAPRDRVVTVAGHINEAGDLFAEDYAMPEVREGDIVALLNAGGYHQEEASWHCLRAPAPGIHLVRQPELPA